LKQSRTSAGAVAESIRVQEIMPRVVEIQMIGYISRAASALALERVESIMKSSPDTEAMLWDLTRNTGSDPGNLALAVRWMREHGTKIRTSAVVSSSSVISGFVRVARVLLPDRESEVFSHREDALAYLSASSQKRRGRAA
jgi:hypothetical protein